MNTTNIIQTILNGDMVTITSAILLLIMSIMTWVIFVRQYQRLHLLQKYLPSVLHQQFSTYGKIKLNEPSKSADHGPTVNQDQNLSRIEAILNMPQTPKNWLDLGDLNPIDQRLLTQKIHHQLHQGFNTLATITSMSPFIGLLGTVWGIYHALGKLALNAQNLQIQELAGPVSEALIMTAFGLIVALPSLLAYNILNKKSKPIWQLFQTYWQHI
jgi:biopolymer transport protein ExbB